MKFEPIDTAKAAKAALPPGMCELRRFLRREIKAKGSVRYMRRRYQVEIENLSEQGCQLRMSGRSGIVPGESVTLSIETLGPFEAIVRWHNEGWTGIEFDLPVYPPVLDHIHTHFDRRD